MLPPLAGCRGALSALDPASPAAASVASLWWIMAGGATVLFAAVMVLLSLTYIRPGFAADTSSRIWLLHAGVLMPLVILVALTGAALELGERLVTSSAAETMRVQVLASRWSWRFRYPHFDDATSTVLHIPVGRPVEVRITSADVIHSFWVPRLAGKIDAIPGHDTRVMLQADSPGEYEGQCAEFCGLGHAGMRFRVIAHDAERYGPSVLDGTP